MYGLHRVGNEPYKDPTLQSCWVQSSGTFQEYAPKVKDNLLYFMPPTTKEKNNAS